MSDLKQAKSDSDGFPSISVTSSLTPRKKAIVIGAGVGGVSTAARLSYAGFDVTVVEQNTFSGGRCSIFNDGNGHRFDQGPSLLLLPRLFRECFNDLGTSLEEEGVQIVKCEPNYNIYFGDGEQFRLSTDLVGMKNEVQRFEGEDGFEGYLSFLKEAHTHYELSIDHVLHQNFTSLLSMLRPSFLRQLLVLHPFTSIYTRASHYFKTDRLRRVFTFASMYLGMSPFDSLGTYSLLQYTELTEGIWYPIGGFHKIVDALVKISERAGTKYRYGTKVSKVVIDDHNRKQVRGVLLEDGEIIEADVVVVNADLIWSLNNLFEPTSYSKRLLKKSVSCSSISFYWSIDRKVPELSAHSIFLADEYKESFDAIFNDHAMPREPSFYVNVPSRTDPSAAPPNCDTIVVLVPVGHLSDKLPASTDWQQLVDKAREFVFQVLQERLGLTEFRHWIKNESVNTPITWRDKFNLHRGSILGLSHSFFNVLSFRPKTRHPSIKGVYFVGASTHPGTGVPICLAGSRVTTEQILGDLALPSPWIKGDFCSSRPPRHVSNHELDVKRYKIMLGPEDLFLYTFLALAAAFMLYHSVIAR